MMCKNTVGGTFYLTLYVKRFHIGSISVALSCPGFAPPRGKSAGSYSRTVVGNRP